MLRRKNTESTANKHEPQVEPIFVDLAKSLTAAVDVALEDASFIPTSELDLAIARAYGDVVQTILPDRVRELSTSELVSIHERLLGASALEAAFAEEAVLRAEQLNRQNALEVLRTEASIERKLQLGKLCSGEVLEIGLFKPDEPRKAAHRYADDTSVASLYRTMQVRLVDSQKAAVDVLHDTWEAPRYAGQVPSLLTPHARGRIGVRTADVASDGLIPEIWLHSPLDMLFDSTVETTKQIVGYVKLGDGKILLDG